MSTIPAPSPEFLDEEWKIADLGWIEDLELEAVKEMTSALDQPIKVLVLYGSLRCEMLSALARSHL